MSRGRAWRREQYARRHALLYARIKANGLYGYSLGWSLNNGIEYHRRNSVDEMILVTARTREEFEYYWRLRASREVNNPHPCNCTWCHNERGQGMGNAATVLSPKERSALFQGVDDIDLYTEDVRPINHTWRRRKAYRAPKVNRCPSAKTSENGS